MADELETAHKFGHNAENAPGAVLAGIQLFARELLVSFGNATDDGVKIFFGHNCMRHPEAKPKGLMDKPMRFFASLRMTRINNYPLNFLAPWESACESDMAGPVSSGTILKGGASFLFSLGSWWIFFSSRFGSRRGMAPARTFFKQFLQ